MIRLQTFRRFRSVFYTSLFQVVRIDVGREGGREEKTGKVDVTLVHTLIRRFAFFALKKPLFFPPFFWDPEPSWLRKKKTFKIESDFRIVHLSCRFYFLFCQNA